MCGRSSFKRGADVNERFRVSKISPEIGKAVSSFPFGLVPAVLEVKGQRLLWPFRWGFDEGFPSYNARLETIDSTLSWMGPWKRGDRLIFPVDTFAEMDMWFVPPETVKDKFFSIGGLWIKVGNHPRATMITVPATGENKRYKRMPLILPPKLWDQWLAPGPVDKEALLKIRPPLQRAA